MYKGYVIDNFDEHFDFNDMENLCTDGIIDLSDSEESMYSVNKKFSSCLDKFVLNESVNKDLLFDGTKIINECFSKVKADFFISHKHEDEEQAKQLEAYLQSKGKSVFIDSGIWGDIKTLQETIDKDYCSNKEKTFYYYGLRNKSTSYTHMLLANALLKTIVNCETFVFLNTPNSIKAENIITDISETNSPWLYFEINVANALLPEKAIIESHENFSYMPEMTFEADLKRFEKVNVEFFLLQCGFKKTEDWNCKNACFEEKFR